MIYFSEINSFPKMEDDIVFRRDNSDVSYEDNDNEEQEILKQIEDDWDKELKFLLTPDPIEEEPDLNDVLYPPKNPWDAPEDSGDEDEFPWEQTPKKRLETMTYLLSKPFDSLMQEDKDSVTAFLKRFSKSSVMTERR